MDDVAIRGERKAAASRRRIITAAAELFAQRGYDGTSIREIAAAVSMTTAALYYHFASKEDLYVAVHGQCMAAVEEAVAKATWDVRDPWERLEAAVAAHCAALLGNSGNSTILSNIQSIGVESVRSALIAQRDAYEQGLQTLIDALPLDRHTDRRLLRLQILGSVNFMPLWFRAHGRLKADDIGRIMVRQLRDGLRVDGLRARPVRNRARVAESTGANGKSRRGGSRRT